MAAMTDDITAAILGLAVQLPEADLQALLLIGRERVRQIKAEGYDTGHDDKYQKGELAIAAAAFAVDAANRSASSAHTRQIADDLWPWSPGDRKPADAQRNMEKAGACGVAELARIIRASKPGAIVI
jgi:hypothetical protein